jgi:hypothetical protein
MREIRPSGSEGGGANNSPYPYPSTLHYKEAPFSPFFPPKIILKIIRLCPIPIAIRKL